MRAARANLDSFQAEGLSVPGRSPYRIRTIQPAEPAGHRSPQWEVLDSIGDPLMVLDRSGCILHTSGDWDQAGGGGSPGLAGPARRGRNYLELSEQAGAESALAPRLAKGVRAVLAGEAPRFRMQYSCLVNGHRECRVVLATPLRRAEGGALLVRTDVTRERSLQVRTLSRMLLAAHERERQAIARELHDGVTQTIAATAIDLAVLASRLGGEPEGTRVELGRLVERLRGLATQVQGISRQMHPHALRTLGLPRALEEECRLFAGRTGIAVSTRVRCDGDLPKRTPLAVFRIAQEALSNVARHARATSVRVELERSPDELRLVIKDNGIGLTPGARRTGIGMASMQERALSEGARLAIVSLPGRGTTIKLTIPLAAGQG